MKKTDNRRGNTDRIFKEMADLYVETEGARLQQETAQRDVYKRQHTMAYAICGPETVMASAALAIVMGCPLAIICSNVTSKLAACPSGVCKRMGRSAV